MSEQMTLSVTFAFNTASGLFDCFLENGARFSVSQVHISGKLGANLDLLRQYTLREAGDVAPHPHVCVADFGEARDAKLVAEAIVAGKLNRAGVKDATPLLDF